jgi:hypothetical protein
MKIALVQQSATHDKSAIVRRGLAALEAAAQRRPELYAEWLAPSGITP